MKDLTTNNTMRERADENRYKLWVLLNMNRWLLTGVMAAGVFLALMLWGMSRPPSAHQVMVTTDWVKMSFQALIGALITGTTLVVSINQLVLSQEIGPLGSQRRRMDLAMDFYKNTDDLLDFPSPANPALFLKELIDASSDRARAFEDSVQRSDDEGLRTHTEKYVEDLCENAEVATDDLENADFGSFDVMKAALNYNYDRKMYDLRWLLNEYEGSLTSEQRDAGTEALTALTMYGPAREYIKTLYFQWSLVKLSQGILYLAVPALVVAGGMVMLVDGSTFVGTILGIDLWLWVISAAYTICVLPFLLFVSYILRLATIAKRTSAMGPLVLRGD
ncbi:hypothetical protein CV102_10450 [Natronococcus pandeyae]|uniref:Uncharacterized protein n=1 Tax=Natronococcus pandeyae TaxID=2055836 RepID=A0A8J8TST5_9EURY|nr:hypothetical protein [Natronococcus pandeyae]TYL38917.1 hypothetical protein CV102_10450 [Natronococcus pandeyae]